MSEVARAGLRTPRERDAVERWLREDGVGVYDAVKARPGRAISPQDLAERMRARHEVQLEKEA